MLISLRCSINVTSKIIPFFCITFLFHALAQGRICQDEDIRNDPSMLEKLRNCTVLVGDLKILLMERVISPSEFDNYTYPELKEITGYLMLNRVLKLTSIGRLFPNLRVIRGTKLFVDYSLILYDMPDIEEIGLTKLIKIERGGLKIDKCPKLCFVNTVDWDIIGNKSISVHFTNINNGTCPFCSPTCEGNRCWNAENCQRMHTDKCHPECLDCSVAHSAKNCHACRNFDNDGECVKECPKNKLRLNYASRCVSEEECKNKLNGTWIFDKQCVNACPKKYKKTESHLGCEFCGDDCINECSLQVIDSRAKLEELKSCTHVTNSLDIRLHGSYSEEELEEYFGQIKSIKGFLKIVRSSSIKSLNILKNLKVIHGEYLDNNHSIFIYQNQNLQKLWDFNENFALKIENGSLSFQDNPQLCLSEIEQLANLTGLTLDYVDVSKYSNGDKSACNVWNISITILEMQSRNVTLTWKPVNKNENETFIGYAVSYMEHKPNFNITDETENACTESGWKSNFSTTNKIQLLNLRPFTNYVYYIKAYRSSMLSSQSRKKFFKTYSDDPDKISGVRSVSNNYSSITISWERPKYTNGALQYYLFTSYLEKDHEDLISERNYCLVQHNHEPKYSLFKNYMEQDQEEEEDYEEEEKESFTSPIDNCSCSNAAVTKVQKSDKQKFHIDEVQLFYYGGSCTNISKCENVKYNIGNDMDIYEEFTHLQKRGGSVKKSHYSPLKYNSLVKEIKVMNTSITDYTITNLRHFSLYVFYVSVCNKNRTKRQQCSEVEQTFHRTKKDPQADNIDKVFIKVFDTTNIRVNWTEPGDPNGVIVAYNIEFQNIDLKDGLVKKECVTRSQHVDSKFYYYIDNLRPGKYIIRVQAVSLAGPGTFSKNTSFVIFGKGKSFTWVYVSIVIVALTITAMSGAYFYYLRKRRKQFENMHLITSINPDYAGVDYVEDEWEIQRDNIDILNEIGQGTFGIVYNGLLKPRNIPCAVKTLTEENNLTNKLEFLNEATVMKSFSDTHHVVKLLGVVSRGQPPLVVMEVMEKGDLKAYLRKCRDSSRTLTFKDMYLMAIQIADGMSYLAAKKFVHRDLAARNCMVTADCTVKIGDFGMARDIYETEYYRKETKGLLPVRWMAPESLADGVFTSDSDVWSYGIVLWEIVTLAEQPYQGMSNEQVWQFVVSKGVLSRPPDCPEVFNEIMEACWLWRPNNRPTFIDIVEKLEEHVGENFKLVSFYHSRDGNEYRMNAHDRAFNPPAMSGNNYHRSDSYHDDDSYGENVMGGNYSAKNDNVSLYFGRNRPNTSSHSHS